MIKILFFIENLNEGGAEKVLRDLVNHMDQGKFEITVQTLWPCEEGKRLNHGIRYRSVFTSRNKLTEALYRLEAALKWMYPLHIKDDYDIEAAYLEMGSTKIMAGSTNKHAVKLAWVHCNLKKAMACSQTFIDKTKKWYAAYDKVVCVSQSVKDAFDEMYGGHFDSVVINNVVDDAQILALSNADLPLPPTEDLPILCAVGRLAAPKNYLRLLCAHRQLLSEGLAHQLWIVGEGPERPKLEAFIAEYGLHDSVRLLGFQNNPYPFMARADILVCSSDYEGLSTFVAEGIILGKPIVTTDCGGMQELFGDSECGLITDVSDKSFTDGVRKLLRDPNERELLAQRATICGKSLSAMRQTKRTEDFFLALAKEKSEP